MTKFSASALTHLLVVTDPQASRDWYVNVLDASVYAEYGGTSIVLDLSGTGSCSYRGENRPPISRQ